VPYCTHRRRAAAGFSLIETLVALLVAGLALTAIAEVFGTGLLGHQTSDTTATALSLAESHMAMAASGEPLTPRQAEGTVAGRFHWLLTVAPYEDPQKSISGFAQPAASLRLYRIAVAVDWRDGWRQRQLALDTLRLGPAPP
jgi:prepilin-type N-terminal cleavage/methylation domain-containing protein